MGYYAIPTESFIAVTATPKIIVAGNPYRTGLIFYATVAASAVLSTSASVLAAGGGIPISPLITPFSMTYREYGSLVQLPWYGASSGGGNIGVIETILVRWPSDPPADQADAGAIQPARDYWPGMVSGQWRRSPTFAGSFLSAPSAAELDEAFARFRR
jgi:hypothetical protein